MILSISILYEIFSMSISILYEIFSMFWYLFDVLCHLSLPTSLRKKWFISECLKMEYGVIIICFCNYGIICSALI
jgi:hypothetical protein